MNPKLMFFRPAIILSVALMAGMTLTGCSDEENGDIQPIKVEYNQVIQTDFAAHSNDFANNLLAKLAEKKRSERRQCDSFAYQYAVFA